MTQPHLGQQPNGFSPLDAALAASKATLRSITLLELQYTEVLISSDLKQGSEPWQLQSKRY